MSNETRRVPGVCGASSGAGKRHRGVGTLESTLAFSRARKVRRPESQRHRPPRPLHRAPPNPVHHPKPKESISVVPYTALPLVTAYVATSTGTCESETITRYLMELGENSLCLVSEKHPVPRNGTVAQETHQLRGTHLVLVICRLQGLRCLVTLHHFPQHWRVRDPSGYERV